MLEEAGRMAYDFHVGATVLIRALWLDLSLLVRRLFSLNVVRHTVMNGAEATFYVSPGSLTQGSSSSLFPSSRLSSSVLCSINPANDFCGDGPSQHHKQKTSKIWVYR